MKYILALILATACVTIPNRTSESPTFSTYMGVQVYCDGSGYITRSMTDKMEEDLVEVMTTEGISARTIWSCIRGQKVYVNPNDRVECSGVPVKWETTRAGNPVPTFGQYEGCTHVFGHVEIATVGNCAFDHARMGPAYLHELAHVVRNCLLLPYDIDHEEAVWKKLSIEHPCSGEPQ